MAVLNYRYRLYPTPEQHLLLGRTMFFICCGWTRMKQEHAPSLRARLLKSEMAKATTTQRAGMKSVIGSARGDPEHH
jgi:hypothetical protein